MIAQPASPQIPDRQLSIADFGAKPDGISLCSDAFALAIDSLAKQGGGRVVVPEGVWLTGPIELKSHIDLHLADNAMIVFSPDKSLYDIPGANRGKALISAKKATDIAVTGHGTIDGGGKYWRPVKRSKVSDVEWKAFNDMGGTLTDEGKLWFPFNLTHFAPLTDTPQKEEGKRADLFRVTACQRIQLSGVTFQNSPRFHVHPCQSSDVIIDGITVRCPWNAQNGDGIDLSNCKRVLLVNSTVDVGDDAICMKSGIGEKGAADGPVSDVLVSRCTVYHGHGGFVLGSDCAGGMQRIVVSHCTFSGTDTGLRFKSAVGRGGKTSKIFISDVVMNDIKDQAVVFSCAYEDRKYSVSSEQAGKVKTVAPFSPEFADIHISHVVCREAATAVFAEGMDDWDAVHDVSLSDCSFFFTKQDKAISDNCHLTFNNVSFKTF